MNNALTIAGILTAQIIGNLVLFGIYGLVVISPLVLVYWGMR